MKKRLTLLAEIYVLHPVLRACPTYIIGPLGILVTLAYAVDTPCIRFGALEFVFMNLGHIHFAQLSADLHIK